MKASLIYDIVFLGILAVSIYISWSKGAVRAVSGLLGTGVGLFGAIKLAPKVSPLLEGIITPIVKKAVEKTAIGEGIGEIINSSAMKDVSSVVDSFGHIFGFGGEGGQGLFSDIYEAGASALDVFSAKISQETAVIIAFIALFVIIKAGVGLVLRLININKLPLIGTLNRLAGAILGALSGLILVAALCWGMLTFAPEGQVGFFNRQDFNDSFVGGIAAGVFSADGTIE